ncbi:tRNA pseudouridine synthase Pus10 [uncultured archaeon]|nr:tRNA pseudouridine synthase Pus10 [uncultured archaeon]
MKVSNHGTSSLKSEKDSNGSQMAEYAKLSNPDKGLMVQNTADKIFKTGYVCDHCLGRQFGQLLSGYTHEERGRAIRTVLAMSAEIGEFPFNENFRDIKFRLLKAPSKPEGENKPCWVCEGLFEKIGEIAKRAAEELKGIEFNTFHVGVTLSKKLLLNEEKLWESAGIDYCESIKTEIGREVGKQLSRELGKIVDLKNPDIVLLLNLERNAIELTLNPIYIAGRYKKFAKIPQTTWYCPRCHGTGCDNCNWTGRLAKTSVQEIIAEPLLKATKGTGTRFHGAGREDADVLCLASRDFIIEILEPRKRKIDLKKIKLKASDAKKVEVNGLKFVSKEDIVKVKEMKAHKVYKMIVTLGKPVTTKDLEGLKTLKATISQRTPQRVAHRRADIVRRRKIFSIKYKLVNSKTLELEVETEAGLYVKELVSGDEGRTKPSVSDILKVPASVKELNVIGIKS